MKVIFVIPNLSSGGAERVISILANSFVKKNIEVDILFLQDRTTAYQVSNEVNLVYFDVNLMLCPKRFCCKIIRKYLKEQKKEHDKVIVIPFLDVCLKRALAAAAGLNIPIIASERNDPYQKGSSHLNRIKANIPYMLASKCVFQSPGAKEYYYTCVQKKGEIILNPLVMSEDIRWKGQNSKRIVTVGRLESQKNHLMLMEAFANVCKAHPEYTLEIYGEGSLKKTLQSKIDELKLENSVFLRGHSPNIPQILEEAYMFVLSSDYEGLSNALIEALAVGMPVVSTDHPCGGAGLLVQNDVNGILVPTGDADAMANAINFVIENNEFACEIGGNAYKTREKLSLDRITDNWLKVIEKL